MIRPAPRDNRTLEMPFRHQTSGGQEEIRDQLGIRPKSPLNSNDFNSMAKDSAKGNHRNIGFLRFLVGSIF
jgi:hypothetical protein